MEVRVGRHGRHGRHKDNREKEGTEMSGTRKFDCESCRWYDAPQPTEAYPTAHLEGHCHRTPPVVVTVGCSDYLTIASVFPETAAGSFCGEWIARDEASSR